MFGAKSNPELPRSEELRRILADATTEALQLSHEYIGTEHVLLALVNNPGTAITVALAESGITPQKVRETLGHAVRHGRASTLKLSELPHTTRTKTALSRAEDAARELGQMQVAPEHLLVGFMRERMNIAAQVLQQHGMTLEKAEEIARHAQQ